MQRVKKSEIITLRVTPRVKETIRERAKAAGLTVTDYLCYSGLGKEIVRVEGLEQVLSELKAQGRNLNQLTTLANICLLYTSMATGSTKATQRSAQAVLPATCAPIPKTVSKRYSDISGKTTRT